MLQISNCDIIHVIFTDVLIMTLHKEKALSGIANNWRTSSIIWYSDICLYIYMLIHVDIHIGIVLLYCSTRRQTCIYSRQQGTADNVNNKLARRSCLNRWSLTIAPSASFWIDISPVDQYNLVYRMSHLKINIEYIYIYIKVGHTKWRTS